ncbi:MAG: glycosyltransferase, partial [Solirubrobacteraceae bacterium]|nr:glycosyltransferase [Solirubrobacteraceae bacterium]
MRRRSAPGGGPGPLKVLVVNQTATTSGAEHSLLTLLAAFDPGDVTVLVACPVGALSERVVALGHDHLPIQGTEASFRLNLRTTPVELLAMLRSGAKVGRAARRRRVDLVHANTTRAGLIAVAARLFGAPRPLVHVRDWAPPSRAATLVNRVIARGAGAIIANSRFIAGNFDGLRTHGPVRVIHNPVDLTRFDPTQHDRAAARQALPGLGAGRPEDAERQDSEPLVVGVVGQLTPWKGQDDAVKAMAVVLERPDLAAARLVIAGSAKFATAAARYDNAAYADTLAALPARLGIDGSVALLGEVDDVPAVLAALDVL